jgi:hypothetical protein
MRIMATLLVGGILLNFSPNAHGQTAPFGFSWGPVDKVSRPSDALREGNVTRLVYRHERLPPNELRDTEEIILEVCKIEGLQQIIWVSRVLSVIEMQAKFEEILSEGVRQHGKTETIERGVIKWSAAGTLMARISNGQRFDRILMVSVGPRLDSCSEEHRMLTGHSLSDHWIRYLPSETPAGDK